MLGASISLQISGLAPGIAQLRSLPGPGGGIISLPSNNENLATPIRTQTVSVYDWQLVSREAHAGKDQPDIV